MCKDPVTEREWIILLGKRFQSNTGIAQSDYKKTLGVIWGEVGFAGPRRDALRNYRQLTCARG